MKQTLSSTNPSVIQVFNHERFGAVRTLTNEKGDIFFAGKDVAKALGYTNTRDALGKHVDDEDKTTVAICDTGSNYKTRAVVINEIGLYALVLSSKLPSAKAFKHWVTAEVLPQIRQTGGYIPLKNPRTGEALSEEEVLEAANRIVGRTLTLMNSQNEDCLTATKVAESWGMEVGSFNKLLRQMGIQQRKGGRWQLTDDFEGRGLTEDRFFFCYSLKGEPRMKRYMVWTPEGVDFLNSCVKAAPLLTRPLSIQMSLEFKTLISHE